MEAGCSEGQGCGILREPRAVAAQGGGGWHRKDITGTEQLAGGGGQAWVSSVFAQHRRGWAGKCSEPYPVNSVI